MVDLAEVKWFRADGDEVGPARRALDESLGGRSLSGMDLVTAEIARGAAELTDSARAAQDARMWLASSARLLALTAQLRAPAATSEASGDGAADAGDDGDDLADLMGAGPEMGDAADA